MKEIQVLFSVHVIFSTDMYFNKKQQVKVENQSKSNQRTHFFQEIFIHGVCRIKKSSIFAPAKRKWRHSSVGRAKD